MLSRSFVRTQWLFFDSFFLLLFGLADIINVFFPLFVPIDYFSFSGQKMVSLYQFNVNVVGYYADDQFSMFSIAVIQFPSFQVLAKQCH